MRRATTLAAVLLVALLAAAAVPAAADPLAGIVLEDGAGRSWRLDELRGAPVAVIDAARLAVDDARAWGARLAAEHRVLAPWPAPGRVTWLVVADLRGVPEYARESARARIRDWDAARGAAERAASAPLLLDWEGVVAARLGGRRGHVLVAVLDPDHAPLAQATGAPTDDAVARVTAALAAAAAAPARSPAPRPS